MYKSTKVSKTGITYPSITWIMSLVLFCSLQTSSASANRTLPCNGHSSFQTLNNVQSDSDEVESAFGLGFTQIDSLKTAFAASNQFHTSLTPEGIQLSWESSADWNVSYYDIQKWNGEDFESIGKVEPKGSQMGVQTFLFLDKLTHSGPNIYRVALHAVGIKEAALTTSSIANVQDKEVRFSHLFKIAPNPGHGVFTLESPFHAASESVVFISDYSGKVIKTLVQAFDERGLTRLDLNDLPVGNYLLGIAHADYPQTAKIIIE